MLVLLASGAGRNRVDGWRLAFRLVVCDCSVFRDNRMCCWCRCVCSVVVEFANTYRESRSMLLLRSIFVVELELPVSLEQYRVDDNLPLAVSNYLSRYLWL